MPECICLPFADYGRIKTYVEDCPEHRCGLHIFTDDLSVTCCLEKGHEGFCRLKSKPHVLTVQPYQRKREIYEEDPEFKSVSRGDGLAFTVPTWVAEILQRHANEVV